MKRHEILIVGGGPAGLMAAEQLSSRGHAVTVYDALPSLGRKFLLAGKSGLNITHSEGFEAFAGRYGDAATWLRSCLEGFSNEAVIEWTKGLGIETFVGSSGRVFPKAMKASPLLRAWLRRLEQSGVQFRPRHRWVGFDGDALLFDAPDGRIAVKADSVLLALGGASWPRLGADGSWVELLRARGVTVNPLRPANCGFDVAWSDLFRERFAGAPVKAVTITTEGAPTPGEFVISRHGIEGSLVYAHSAWLRDRLDAGEKAALAVDLVPGRTLARLKQDLARQNAKASLSTRLRKGASLEGVKAALVRECLPADVIGNSERLAEAIKALPLMVQRTRPIAEAISVAGGVAQEAVDDNFMLRSIEGVFVAGEMLDWEAPTGGYLLTACLASGHAAGLAMHRWLKGRQLD